MQPQELSVAPNGSGLLWVALRAERFIGGALLVAMVGLVLSQVLARHLMGSPFLWTEELARVSLIWLTLIGSTFVMAEENHITVDIIPSRVGRRGRALIDMVSITVTLIASAAMSIVSLAYMPGLAGQELATIGVPYTALYLSITVGFGLIALHALLLLLMKTRLLRICDPHPEASTGQGAFPR